MLLEVLTHIFSRAILISLGSAAAFVLMDSIAEAISRM
ncbi:hypothetical protein DFR38_10554 [Aquitalea magnusonii]|uniref:Uncharacterized protein n=1 Tax=Aquitalea magnusonii TaxID=332411 RepID=A0A318JFM6_9NEIS|nr:hypothetical protein DFR38_10554 [Aquitalea magnusonii]